MMATWVTHLLIADRIMEIYPQLDRRSFCAGSIAPDCNVENADWTAFTPSREVTHWMENEKKTAADCDRFCTEYLLPRIRAGIPREEYAFLLSLSYKGGKSLLNDGDKLFCHLCVGLGLSGSDNVGESYKGGG